MCCEGLNWNELAHFRSRWRFLLRDYSACVTEYLDQLLKKNLVLCKSGIL
jgi:hypothetical protein